MYTQDSDSRVTFNHPEMMKGVNGEVERFLKETVDSLVTRFSVFEVADLAMSLRHASIKHLKIQEKEIENKLQEDQQRLENLRNQIKVLESEIINQELGSIKSSYR